MKLKNRKDFRVRRHLRLRHKVRGTAERPRMAISVSNSNMYVQFVDDDARTTIASVSTLGMDAKLNCQTAKELGGKAASAASEKGIKIVVVDRGGFKYHGRVKTVVEAAVAGGLRISAGESDGEVKESK